MNNSNFLTTFILCIGLAIIAYISMPMEILTPFMGGYLIGVLIMGLLIAGDMKR